MNVTVLTAFPEFLGSFLSTGVIGRAIERGLITVRAVDLRDFSKGNYRQIDDYSFGGKGGMTIMPEVLEQALDSVKGERTKVLFPTPAGAVLTQDLVESLALENSLVIVCGRYEGLDERFVQESVDLEYSIGDYVLTGGEIPAMTLIDALARLVPGVVGKESSVTGDSFYDGMLDTPHYTRPAVWRGEEVPEPLTSGDDARISKYRRRTAAFLTLSRRPDLLSRANVMDYLEDEVYLGLVVSPADPTLRADMAEIVRAARAYGIARVIAAPRDGVLDDLRAALADVPEVKCVPSVRRMTDWAERKKRAPLLTIAAETQPGVPWLEAKRRLVETDGPTLILFGAQSVSGNAFAMRPQQTTGGELPRTALVTATLDRFFGSR